MNNDKTNEAIEILKSGGTILYPTDTVWGIGCDATNDHACQKLVDLKTRPTDSGYILLADNFQMVERFVPDFAEVVYDLVDLAVEPLTIIYPSAKGISKHLTAKDGTIAIRITKDPICQKLIRGIRKPIVAALASFSRESFGSDLKTIDSTLKTNIDFILHERENERLTKTSQIIRIDLDGRVSIIRK